MPAALEVVNSYVTNPSGFTAHTALSGDSFTVRAANPSSRVRLCGAWATAATVGQTRIHSPRMHDNVQGILMRHDVASTPRDKLALRPTQPLQAQDTLVVETGTTGTESDGTAYIVYYDDLPGATARFIDVAGLAGRIRNVLTQEVDVASGAAIGAYSTARAINADFDLMKGNTDYAFLGYEVDTTGLSVGLKGPDTSNFRLGGPMTTENLETRDWFVRLTERIGVPLIPIINSANKAGTFTDTAQVVSGVAAKVTWIIAELSS